MGLPKSLTGGPVPTPVVATVMAGPQWLPAVTAAVRPLVTPRALLWLHSFLFFTMTHVSKNDIIRGNPNSTQLMKTPRTTGNSVFDTVLLEINDI